MVFLVEILEHWPAYNAMFDLNFWQEMAVYGLIGPFFVWVLLTMLARALIFDLPIERIQAEASHAERQRIARDLHDRLGQNLAYLHFKLDQLAFHTAQVTPDEIQSIQSDLEQMRLVADAAYRQIRGTLNNLRSDSDTPENLVLALQQQAQAAKNRDGLEVAVNLSGQDQPICRIVQRTMLDIIRESLTNITKHAQTHRADIHLICNTTNSTLTISDNGRGFTANGAGPNGHYGLKIMQERAAEVGGQLEIKSSPENGTQIIGQFPNAVINDALLSTCSRLQCEYINKCTHEHTSR